MIFIEAVLTIVILDFVSGLAHWFEDTFWTEETPIVGKWLVEPNVLHHHNATAFVKNSWLQSSWDLLAAGIAILLVAYFTGTLSWHVWMFVLVGIHLNQIHKWNHMPKAKVPKVVRFLQYCRVLQTPHDHARHHRGDKNLSYCVFTPYVNIVLDKIRFWRLLEKILIPTFPAPRRTDIIHNKTFRPT